MSTFETFREPTGYTVGSMTQKEPSCFNGIVSVYRYRVTIELIEEPTEVIAARIQKLWEECDNMHHFGPLRKAAEKIGLVLDSAKLNIRKKKLPVCAGCGKKTS